MALQILMLGNGLNLSYGGMSWRELLTIIATQPADKVECIQNTDIPAPLKAIAVTEDRIDIQMKLHRQQLYGRIISDEQQSALLRLLNMGFDHILTTNYSYELEEASLGLDEITDARLRRIQTHTSGVSRAETQYLLHTFMNVPCNNGTVPVWHIHGEARKPDSMILGHYYYGNQLFRIKELLKERKDSYRERQTQGLPVEVQSWVDAFIMGDLYILGFGMDISEMDLWWLLNRRKREHAQTGKIFFYEPEDDGQFAKYELLRLLGVERISFGMKKSGADYKRFYELAMNDMEKRVSVNACGKCCTEADALGHIDEDTLRHPL